MLATRPLYVKQRILQLNTGQLNIADAQQTDTWNVYIWSNIDIQKEISNQSWTGGICNVSFSRFMQHVIKTKYTTQVCSSTHTLKSGCIALLTHDTSYIKSPEKGHFSEHLTARRARHSQHLCGSVPFGELIIDSRLNSKNFTDCSRISFLNKKVACPNHVYGLPLSLHGHHTSLNWVFNSALYVFEAFLYTSVENNMNTDNIEPAILDAPPRTPAAVITEPVAQTKTSNKTSQPGT